MPADEKFYRDQKKLHLVFFYSAIALFGATLWMMGADHFRSWKTHQREFANVKQEKLAADLVKMQVQLDQQKLEDLQLKLKKAQAERAKQQPIVDSLKSEILALELEKTKLNRRAQFKKAEVAELASSYDLVVKKIAEAGQGPRLAKLEEKKEEVSEKLAASRQQFEVVNKLVGAKDLEVKKKQASLSAIESGVVEVQGEVEKLTGDIAKLERVKDATKLSVYDEIRAAPVLDGFASPLQIKQVALEDLPVDFNFKKVTRFDRCQTCHLAIDQAGYTEQAGIKPPYLSHPNLDLFVGANSPHPVEKFGCTICHQGQGTATSFEWASHSPDNEAERERWTKEYGWFFNHFHEYPMFPTRFSQSSCLKCHHDPYQVPEADKLLSGYQTIRTYGCFGCHEINGFMEDGTQFGPHLRLAQWNDSEEEKLKANRKVGPTLAHVTSKLTPEFIAKWVRDPQAFRPSTRMPQYYHQIDMEVPFYNSHGPVTEFDNPHDLPTLAITEVHAITKYLETKSKKVEVPSFDVKGNAEAGKGLFLTKGCVACHSHKEIPEQFAKKPNQFGPDLSEIAAKFTTDEQKKWLVAWIHDPTFYNPETYMPNLQLSPQDSADIAAYLLSVPGTWAKEISVPSLDEQALTDLLLSLEKKGNPEQVVRARIDGMSTDDKLMALGEKTIGRLGCFGCHNIDGFDKAKPIGVALSDWGKKDPHMLAFENVLEYVEEEVHKEGDEHFYSKNDFYQWALGHHQREGFLMQKLREPRSYDFKKIRRWEDRSRMPRFNFTDEQREAVATFVLGLVAEEVNAKYVYNPSPEKMAEVHGRNLLDKYNCSSCHVIEPGEWTFELDQEGGETLASIGKKELAAGYDFPGHSAWSVSKSNPSLEITARGLPYGLESPDDAEDPDNLKVTIQLWEALSVLDQTVPAGVRVRVGSNALDAKGAVVEPPSSGTYAMALVDYFVKDATQDVALRDKSWQKAPPPLIREGEKVQTPWLYRFLRDPVTIRPSVALRMPRFNFRGGDVEALANYFAAADETPYPYIQIPERDSSYLAKMASAHPDYLVDAYKLITHKDLCIKCHPVGGIKPSGKPEELGPALVRAPERLRPDWMIRWISNPKRLVPYTGMPVNFPKDKPQFQDLFKGSSAEQIKAVRDALINYSEVVDRLLTEQRADAGKKTAAAGNGDVQ
ncbi:Cytochrome c [Planctomycetes bacterium Pan216]|uniref:Cytochrome c n=1 Tax=Kolteria novifilia TaxID=2527975 RepID=A0A518B802_9BACT|nr:Cytochrome c [Planctomycetes bacterium Pan216]